MKTHYGDLKVTAANREQCKDVTKVTGNLYIRDVAGLPALATVGGGLYIGTDTNLPMLTTVGGRLYISNDNVEVDAPQLAVLHGKAGKLLAVSRYALWRSREGYYFAGCRGPLGLAQAVEHWDRPDERGMVFSLAIHFFEATQGLQ
jgi:hypothetical protein